MNENINENKNIDNNDYFNVMALDKGLSRYTQEELDRELIRKKQHSGQEIQITVNGEHLNTKGCEEIGDFMKKYGDVLDKEGFPKENNEVLEGANVMNSEQTVQGKSLEELEQQLQDLTSEFYNNQINADEYNTRLATLEQEKAQIQSEITNVTPSTTVQTENVENKNSELDQQLQDLTSAFYNNQISADEYNTRLVEINNAKVQPSIDISSEPAATKVDNSDAIRKQDIVLKGFVQLINDGNMYLENQDKLSTTAISRAIETHSKEDIEAAIEEANNIRLSGNAYGAQIVDAVNTLASLQNEQVVTNDQPEVTTVAMEQASAPIENETVIADKTVENTTEEKNETVAEQEPELNIVETLQSIIDKKEKSGIDASADCNGKTYDTTGCETIDDIQVKYANDLLEEYKKANAETIKDEEIQKAMYLFELSRGNLTTGMPTKLEPINDIIMNKENEFRKVLAKKDSINWENAFEARKWLQELIPYINIHALSLPVGLENSEYGTMDNYLLHIFEEKGYTTNQVEVNNKNDLYKNVLASDLQELKEYKFFPSYYNELSEEDKALNSERSKDIAEENYRKAQAAKGETTSKKNNEVEYYEQQLGMVTKYIDATKNAFENIKQKRIEVLEAEKEKIINLSRAIDKEYNVQAISNEEKTALDAYRKARKERTGKNINSAFNFILALPDDSKIKNSLNCDTYELYENSKDESVRAEVEQFFKENDIVEKQIDDNEEISNLRQQKEEAVTSFKNKDKEYTKKLEELKRKGQKALKDKTYFESKLRELKNKPAEKQEIVVSNEKDATEKTDTDEDILSNMEIEGLDDEQVEKMTPIKKIKNIGKKLYDKISSIDFKGMTNKSVQWIKKHKKAAIIITGGAVLMTTLFGCMVNNNNNNKAPENTEPKQEADQEEEVTDNVDFTVDEENQVQQQEAQDVIEDSYETTATLTLDEATQQALNGVVDGNQVVYTSADRAANEVEGKTAYVPSWENAEVGAYYTVDDNGINKLTTDEAQQAFADGQDVQVMMENEGTPIGFITAENEGPVR